MTDLNSTKTIPGEHCPGGERDRQASRHHRAQLPGHLARQGQVHEGSGGEAVGLVAFIDSRWWNICENRRKIKGIRNTNGTARETMLILISEMSTDMGKKCWPNMVQQSNYYSVFEQPETGVHEIKLKPNISKLEPLRSTGINNEYKYMYWIIAIWGNQSLKTTNFKPLISCCMDNQSILLSKCSFTKWAYKWSLASVNPFMGPEMALQLGELMLCQNIDSGTVAPRPVYGLAD